MKLISCNGCAVLLDHDKLKFAEDIDDEDGAVDPTKGDYDQDRKDYFAFVPCPVCGGQVFSESA